MNDQEECACGHIRDEHRWYTGSCAVSDCMCFAFEPVAGVEVPPDSRVCKRCGRSTANRSDAAVFRGYCCSTCEKADQPPQGAA